MMFKLLSRMKSKKEKKKEQSWQINLLARNSPLCGVGTCLNLFSFGGPPDLTHFLWAKVESGLNGLGWSVLTTLH